MLLRTCTPCASPAHSPLHVPPGPAKSSQHTWRPASLLWRFIAERASGRFSRASANSRDTMPPNSMSSLQPPHFQPSPGEPWWRLLQPHMAAEPSAHERVTAKATPAEAMACTKADSRVAVERGDWVGRTRQGLGWWSLVRGIAAPCWAGPGPPGVGGSPGLTVTGVARQGWVPPARKTQGGGRVPGGSTWRANQPKERYWPSLPVRNHRDPCNPRSDPGQCWPRWTESEPRTRLRARKLYCFLESGLTAS